MPSRSETKYQDLRQQVELLVSEIDEPFHAAGMGSRHLYLSQSGAEDLLGCSRRRYRTHHSDFLKKSMAKEFCAAQVVDLACWVEYHHHTHGTLLVNAKQVRQNGPGDLRACQMLPSESVSACILLGIVKSQKQVSPLGTFANRSATASVSKSPPSGGRRTSSKTKRAAVSPGLLLLDGAQAGSRALGSPRLEPTDWFSSIELSSE